MKTTGDCEVLIFPRNRRGAVRCMSAASYARHFGQRADPTHQWTVEASEIARWDEYATAQLEALSAILWGCSRLSLSAWAFCLGVAPDSPALLSPAPARAGMRAHR